MARGNKAHRDAYISILAEVKEMMRHLHPALQKMNKTERIDGAGAEMRQKIYAAAERLPYPVRIEEGTSWLHIDCYDTATGKKITTFKG